MQLKEQAYVCTLARTKSISKAAEELFVSQPALSVYITNLEKNLGLPLFERSGKRFELTYVGEKYVEKAQQMLQLREEFQHDLEKIKNQTEGRIRLGTQIRRSPYVVPPVLVKFKKEYPDVDVVVQSGVHGELEEKWEKKELDMILCMKTGDQKDMDYYMVKDERLLLALPENHPLNGQGLSRDGEPWKWMDLRLLKDETFILPMPNQSLRRTVDRLMRSVGFQPRKIVEVTNIELVMQMVAENMGVGFNREGYIKSMYYPKRVCYYEVGDPCEMSQLVLATRKGSEKTPYLVRLLELFKEELEGNGENTENL